MRKMASIQVIEEIQPIEGADKICAYRIKGWWVVDQINNYVVGDRVIFCEIDSWIPHELAPFLSKSSGPREYLGVLGNKLRTVRLRKQLSQGLILPLHKMGEYTQYEVEDDVSEVLGIVKYDPPQRGGMTGMPRGNFPSYIRKTDQERVQGLSLNKIPSGLFEVTEKLEGSSMTVYCYLGEVGVCSRNIDLLETEDNKFWQVARANNLIEMIQQISKDTGLNLALQGELVGESVQGNIYNIKGNTFYLFDIWNIDQGCYMSVDDRHEIANEYDIQHTPVIGYIDVECYKTRDDYLAMAEGQSKLYATQREGLVFKSKDGQFSFKAVSNTYLLKQKD
jgi:RNA ligase (TIGR02306 family)